jgi:hypothetical protein
MIFQCNLPFRQLCDSILRRSVALFIARAPVDHTRKITLHKCCDSITITSSPSPSIALSAYMPIQGVVKSPSLCARLGYQRMSSRYETTHELKYTDSMAVFFNFAKANNGARWRRSGLNSPTYASHKRCLLILRMCTVGCSNPPHVRMSDSVRVVVTFLLFSFSWKCLYQTEPTVAGSGMRDTT